MPRYFALIPAAGSGSRMGADVPKQYLPLLGRPVLWHALSALCAHPAIARVIVVLSADDAGFASADWSAFSDKLDVVRCGGATRADSVRNGLAAASYVGPEDWVLVHDAARPGLDRDSIDRLIEAALTSHGAGALLALPVADTLKRAGAGDVSVETVPRTGLWQAQTPQMFQYALLCRALDAADRATVTDEASAVERLGYAPRLVTGTAANFKITYPGDIAHAERLLQ